MKNKLDIVRASRQTDAVQTAHATRHGSTQSLTLSTSQGAWPGHLASEWKCPGLAGFPRVLTTKALAPAFTSWKRHMLLNR